MTLQGPYRIHIAPQGYEDERIYKPAIDMQADRVVLITHDEDDEKSQRCRERIKEELSDVGTPVDVKECNFFDLDDSLSAVSGVITSHQNDNIKINISTGSKITAVAGTIACMMTSAYPYYAKVEEYGEEPIGRNVSDIVSIPTHPIQLVDEEFLQILGFLREEESEGNNVAIRDLNNYIQENEFSFIAESERDSEDIYDIVNREVIEPLVKREYIKKQQMANKKLLILTEKGKSATELTKHFVST